MYAEDRKTPAKGGPTVVVTVKRMGVIEANLIYPMSQNIY